MSDQQRSTPHTRDRASRRVRTVSLMGAAGALVATGVLTVALAPTGAAQASPTSTVVTPTTGSSITPDSGGGASSQDFTSQDRGPVATSGGS